MKDDKEDPVWRYFNKPILIVALLALPVWPVLAVVTGWLP